MIACERCHSIEVRRVRSNGWLRLLRRLTGRKRFKCMVCGWTALRAWDEHPPSPKGKADLKLVDVSVQARHAKLDPRR